MAKAMDVRVRSRDMATLWLTGRCKVHIKGFPGMRLPDEIRLLDENAEDNFACVSVCGRESKPRGDVEVVANLPRKPCKFRGKMEMAASMSGCPSAENLLREMRAEFSIDPRIIPQDFPLGNRGYVPWEQLAFYISTFENIQKIAVDALAPVRELTHRMGLQAMRKDAYEAGVVDQLQTDAALRGIVEARKSILEIVSDTSSPSPTPAFAKVGIVPGRDISAIEDAGLFPLTPEQALRTIEGYARILTAIGMTVVFVHDPPPNPKYDRYQFAVGNQAVFLADREEINTAEGIYFCGGIQVSTRAY